MAVYYKFYSEKYYKSICVDYPFITLAHLKHRIFRSRYSNWGTDLDIEISNAHTNEEYRDEAMLIPKCTTVLVRRTPKHHRSRLIPHLKKLTVDSFDDVSGEKDAESSNLDDEFGPEIYAPLAKQTPSQASNAIIQSDPTQTTLTLYLQSNTDKGFVPGRDGRTIGGHGSGPAGYVWKKPPQGYVCHRCNVPGHFIQHCPTNRYPDFDIRSSSLPSGGAIETVKLNESLFKNEVGRTLTATYSQGDVPPELNCLLCKEVMKDAVLTRKCCFNSYCDKCIRDQIISKSVCVCGAKNILADDLIPNKTLRDTITRILESSSSSGGRRISSQLQDKEIAPKGNETPKPADEEVQKKVIMSGPTMKPIYNKRKPEQLQPEQSKSVEYESSSDDDEDDRHFKRNRSWYGGPSLASSSPQVKGCRQWRIVQA